MPRTCTICTNDEHHPINVALVSREPYRTIANRYSVSESALKRHSNEHIPELLVKAKQAVESANADDLLGRVESLQARALAILDAAEDTGELRTALGAIREARGNLELMGRLTKELDERPQVNLYLSPEWLELKAVIVDALEPHAAAKEDVLMALGDGGPW